MSEEPKPYDKPAFPRWGLHFTPLIEHINSPPSGKSAADYEKPKVSLRFKCKGCGAFVRQFHNAKKKLCSGCEDKQKGV